MPAALFAVGVFLLLLPGAALAQAGPALSVDASAARHAISDDIYGMNYAPEALAAELRLPVRRWGGNSTSRYNYQIDVHNTGSDYFFQNIPDGSGTSLPNNSTANEFVQQDKRTGTRTMMTVPMMGWVPKRRLNNHPYDCGFKISAYGAQQSVDPFDVDCGNGVRTNGTKITGNLATDTSMVADPGFVTGWVNHLKALHGAASAGGVAYYNLDNEPALWNSTHRDVHPDPLTYDELRDRTYQYGAAVKAADPSAKTLGPAEWGWCNYFYSAADSSGCGPGADRAAHGNQDLVPWYLQQMAAYEQANGVRILDYLDLHYYQQKPNSEPEEIALAPAGTPATQARRLRTTKSLWDPTYTDESWIADLGMGPNRFIPRMKEWVASNYPGTKLAITEYNWGALDHINGALAQADVLGIFGREGLDLATIWDPPDTAEPGAFAFRMYRNYDGAGNGFGDTSVQASSANQDQLAIYAAQRTSDGALTLMVVNKVPATTSASLTSTINLTGFAAQSTAAVHRYTGGASIPRLADQAVGASGFSATFPASSITLFVLLPALDPNLDSDGDGIPNGVETAEGRNPSVKDNDVFGNARLFVMQQYRDFLSREGDAGGINAWVNNINSGVQSRGQVIESFFGSQEFQGTIAPVARLYFAYFLRIPDYSGLNFWIGYYRAGNSLDAISNAFAGSAEFQSRYGALDNAGFVNLVYQNVLGRAPDAGGFAYWKGRLDGGFMTRGQVMLGFSESEEFRLSSDSKVYVTMMYFGMLRRAPDQGGFDFWVNYRNGGNSGLALIDGFLGSPEYRNRFLPCMGSESIRLRARSKPNAVREPN